jgi:hypothetical protein
MHVRKDYMDRNQIIKYCNFSRFAIVKDQLQLFPNFDERSLKDEEFLEVFILDLDFVDKHLKLHLENLSAKNKTEEKSLTFYKIELNIK